MQITIESVLGGNVAGYLQCTVSGDESLNSLISSFCDSKSIPVNPDFVLRDKKGMTLDSRKRLSDFSISNGDTLYLDIKGLQSGVFKFANWWLLAAGALFMSLAGFATVLSLHLIKGPTPSGFGVVLDGGSSHTALFVYRWDGPKWMGTGVLQQVGTCNIIGDIASLYKNISGIDPFLTPCLNYATSKVPAANRATTPIFFGATAGLRLLNISEPSGAQVLLDGIRNRLSRSGFSFDPSYVEILSGKDEAQFSWITVNTQLHNMGPSNDTIIQRLAGGTTVGALDLGGASTQLSMETPASGHSARSLLDYLWREDDQSNLELYGRNYSVYSSSSLCYGVLEVVKRYHSMLVANLNDSTTVVVSSPCHPSGFEGIVQAEKIFSSPCARNRSSSWTLDSWNFNGTGDYGLCSSMIQGLFNESYCRAHFLPPTCFSNQGQPPVNHRDFLAFSGFNVVARDLNMTQNSSLEGFRQAVLKMCNLSWHEIQHKLPVSNSSFASLLCLESQYVLSLLTSGYGFDEKSWNGLHFAKEISGTDLGWTLGYMTERTNRIAASEASVLLGLPAFVALVVLFALFLLIGMLLSYHAGKMKRSGNSYSRFRPQHTYGSLSLTL